MGQITEARHAWQHALDLYPTWHRTTEATRFQRKLEAPDSPSGSVGGDWGG